MLHLDFQEMEDETWQCVTPGAPVQEIPISFWGYNDSGEALVKVLCRMEKEMCAKVVICLIPKSHSLMLAHILSTHTNSHPFTHLYPHTLSHIHMFIC